MCKSKDSYTDNEFWKENLYDSKPLFMANISFNALKILFGSLFRFHHNAHTTSKKTFVLVFANFYKIYLIKIK